jgi:hypothetical protein
MDNDYKAQAVVVAMLMADMATDGGGVAEDLLDKVLPANTSHAAKMRIHAAIGAAVIAVRDAMP